ncbi:hypothetical protein DPMN_125547 [Dreissena polymorpha]|uniref:Uncharacterized protein n=1 Tax=Dreissena polymorpha TaxID=45954 RepID=A0A9D4JUU1_DREPO|nr:hypothetical protein DPMN_125547 [Dreissena polymorpha]
MVYLFGISTNIINITVLSREDMRNPKNTRLCWLAVAGLLNMVPYVPFGSYESSPEKMTKHRGQASVVWYN